MKTSRTTLNTPVILIFVVLLVGCRTMPQRRADLHDLRNQVAQLQRENQNLRERLGQNESERWSETSHRRIPGSQRPLVRTGEVLDLAIDGIGFFAVELPDGHLGFTRDGNFRVRTDGRISNQVGFPILSRFETVPTGTTGITIVPHGGVRFGGASFAQDFRLALYRFSDSTTLEALGYNIYGATESSGDPISGFPGEVGFGVIVQGSLEDLE